jgi:glutathione S-transferase
VVEWPFDRTLRSPEYLALNPAGRVPALELDGRTIWETGAITEVLCERFPETGMGRAQGDNERIDWLIWVHFAETLSQHIATLTQQHIVLAGGSHALPHPDEDRGQAAEKCYEAIAARLRGRDYLLDGGFSAADVSVGQAVYMARHFVRTEPFADACRPGMTGSRRGPGSSPACRWRMKTGSIPGTTTSPGR